MSHRIFRVPVADVYVHYVNKVERKDRTKAELDKAIRWLTGFSQAELERHLEDGTTFENFFADATLHPNASLITGVVCGIRVEDIEDWYISRFLRLKNTAFKDPDAHFHHLAGLSDEQAAQVAREIWQTVNLPNLMENILPTRIRASLVMRKGADHLVDRVRMRKI